MYLTNSGHVSETDLYHYPVFIGVHRALTESQNLHNLKGRHVYLL